MPTLIESPVTRPLSTLAELLDHLGGISAGRVRLHPAPGTATEKNVVAIKHRENKTVELIDGVLLEKAMGIRESAIALAIASALRAFVVPRKLGFVTGPDGMLRLFPGLVRAPDIAFISASRVSNGELPEAPVPNLVPDLAIEVLSESNTVREMNRKRSDYFSSGVRLVWLIDRRKRSASVYLPDQEPVVISEGESLDGGDVLPGFTLSLTEVFSATRL
jgi:Uma2 family endonuclease